MMQTLIAEAEGDSEQGEEEEEEVHTPGIQKTSTQGAKENLSGTAERKA